MRRLFGLWILILIVSSYSHAQSFTTVTGTTITDGNGQVWSNMTVVANLIPPNGSSLGRLQNQGHAINDTPQYVLANSAGTFSISLDDNSKVTPSGSFWRLSLCSNTSSQCSTLDLQVSGVSMDITTQVQNTISVPTPNSTTTITRGYNINEVTGGNGSLFWRTTDNTLWGCQTTPNASCPPGWIQVGNTTGLLPVATTQGQYPVATGPGQTYVAFDPSEIDVRNVGVDCTFTNDSSAALNAITNNTGKLSGKWLKFPNGCKVKLTNTWFITNNFAFRIGGTIGGTAGGTSNGSAAVKWAGAAGGTMIDMEYADGFNFTNLTIDGGGLADIGINIDKTGVCVGCVNTTDGIFQRLNFGANSTGGATRATYVGLQMSAVSGSNVEDMRIKDSTFVCSSSSPPVGTAIIIGNSANAKNEVIKHDNIHQCAIGVWQKNGSAVIDENEVGGNSLDFRIDSWTDPNESVSDNLSESAIFSTDKFLSITGTVVGFGIRFGGNNIPINGGCAVDVHGNWLISGANTNTFYNAVGGTGPKMCNLGSNPGTIFGALRTMTPKDLSTYSNWSNPGPHATVTGLYGSALVGFIDNSAAATLFSTGAIATERAVYYNNGDNQMGYFEFGSVSQSSYPCTSDTICKYEGSEQYDGVFSPGNPFTTLCTVTGNDVSTIHSYYISAQDASANETFLGPGNASSCNGPAVFDGSHFETISWIAMPHAACYNVYAANTVNPLQINQIATCVGGTSFVFNGPYPVVWPITTPKVAVNKAIIHRFRGKELDFQSGLPLNGYSDEAVTKTWGIDSSTGNASFNNLPPLYNHSGTVQALSHTVKDRCTLGTDCSVTLTGSAVYTSSSSYDCVAVDRTGANPVRFNPSSGSAFALTGTGTDTISYICTGN